MPVTNEWLVEGRVLMTRLKGNISVDEMLQSGQEGTALIESGSAPVYALVDLTAMEHFPTRLVDVKQISDQGTSPKLDHIIIYGIPNRFIAFLATMFTQFIRTRYKVVDTQEDALALVDELESRLLTVNRADL